MAALIRTSAWAGRATFSSWANLPGDASPEFASWMNRV
jgi:hypothetical protein